LASEDLHANGRRGPATPAAPSPKAASLAPPPDPDADARKALRRSARAARSAFVTALAAPVRRGLESALAATTLPHLGRPGILASYAALGDELDPAPLEAAALAAGFTLAFPRVRPDAPLAFHRANFTDLTPGFRGIPEPAPDSPEVRPDILLVPLVAADRTGTRLGQGGGHYDRTLTALRAQGPVRAIGLAWDMQLVARIPTQPWDQPLDAIATPTAFHRAALPARGRA
jgi:5-formyltetrahydrofolate cyclo-ligase